jgi:hypothetical protein
MITPQSLKLLETLFFLEVEHFTNNKPSALFERQMALKKLKLDVLNYIRERSNAIFIIKNTNTTANGVDDFDLCITVNNSEGIDNSQTRIYEIKLHVDCSGFTASLIRGV